jgi:hypothetical protein
MGEDDHRMLAIRAGGSRPARFFRALAVAGAAGVLLLYAVSAFCFLGLTLGRGVGVSVYSGRLSISWRDARGEHERPAFHAGVSRTPMIWRLHTERDARGNWFAWIPLWMPLAASAGAGVAGHVWVRAGRRRGNRCACGYDLSGIRPRTDGSASSGYVTCPECGARVGSGAGLG